MRDIAGTRPPKRVGTLRGFPILVLALLSWSLLAPDIVGLTYGSGGTIYLTIYDYGFRPNNESITTGTTVVWNNTGAMGHTVFSDGTPSFQSSPNTIQPYGQPGPHTYSGFFGQAGVYHYYCSIHPFMIGVLNVTGSPVSPPSGGGGNGQPSPGPTPANGLPDYLVPGLVVTVLLIAGAAIYAWRKRLSGKPSQD